MKYKPSATTFAAFRKAIRKHQPHVRCVSVMPQEDDLSSAYEYLPEEQVTKAQYEATVAAIKEVMDEDIDAEHLACEGGACPVDIRTGDKGEG